MQKQGVMLQALTLRHCVYITYIKCIERNIVVNMHYFVTDKNTDLLA
jgi:hypothetical protein